MPIVNCQICDKQFYVKPSHQQKGWGKYCSRFCRTKAQFLGKTMKCSVCGKEIYRSKSQIKHSKSGRFFCNKSCQIKWKNSLMVGSDHPNWSDGVSIYRDVLVNSDKEQVCKLCGLNDERLLAAHHIDHNRRNNDLSNLTWLCLNCHRLVHVDKKTGELLKKKLKNN